MRSTTLNAQASDCNVQGALSNEHVDGAALTPHVLPEFESSWCFLLFMSDRTTFASLFKIPSKAESTYVQLLQDRKHFVGIKLRSSFPCNAAFLR